MSLIYFKEGLSLFKLGRLVATPSVLEFLSKEEVKEIIRRHSRGDWGDLCEEDKELNNQAVKEETRILSSYTVRGRPVWIITESDRSATTLLFPEEY